jgi:hypothetical protein
MVLLVRLLLRLLVRRPGGRRRGAILPQPVADGPAGVTRVNGPRTRHRGGCAGDLR